MADIQALVTDNLDIWTAAIKTQSTSGRGSRKKLELTGIKKLRELILELAVRGKLVPQDPNDEAASVLLEKIAAEKEQLVTEKKIKKQKLLPEISENEVIFDLPQGWEWTRLGNVSVINPRNIAEDDIEASFVPMPLISTSYKGDHEQEIRKWSDIKKGYTHFSDGDIAVAKITPCFENSKAAVFRGLKNSIGAGTTELHVARPYGETINPLFVLLYLKSPQFLLVGQTKMTGTAGQKRIPKEFFSSNPMALPPLAEQHRIVTKVDELMALCDQLEQQTEASITAHQTLIDTLLDALVNPEQDATAFDDSWTLIEQNFDLLFTTEQSINKLKQTILQLAVMGKLVPQDPNDEPASVLLEKIEAEKDRLIKEKKIKKQKFFSDIGEKENLSSLPYGWIWCNLNTLISIMDAGWSPACPPEPSPSLDKWGVLKTTAVQTMEYRQKENKVLAENKIPKPQYEVKAGDILITRAGPKNRVGISCLVEQTRPKLMISDKIIRFHLFEVGMSERYISLCLNAGLTASYLEKAKSGMAESQMNISQNKLKISPIPLCPVFEQHRIVAKVDELMILCDNLKLQLINKKKTQQNLATAFVEKTLVS